MSRPSKAVVKAEAELRKIAEDTEALNARLDAAETKSLRLDAAESPLAKINDAAAVLVEKHGLSHAEAVSKVVEDDPSLYEAYLRGRS